jgi:hypothetical protein
MPARVRTTLLRLAWFVGLWSAGVLVLAVTGWLLKLGLGM